MESLEDTAKRIIAHFGVGTESAYYNLLLSSLKSAYSLGVADGESKEHARTAQALVDLGNDLFNLRATVSQLRESLDWAMRYVCPPSRMLATFMEPDERALLDKQIEQWEHDHKKHKEVLDASRQ